MRKIIWDEGFKRAVKRQTKNQPLLQAKVMAVIHESGGDAEDRRLGFDSAWETND